jgi:two-component system phosphate regulon sensor histidine kinase PhoR
MNRNIILYTTILIIVGLLGLAGLQFIWFKSALVAKEQTFDRSVMESLNEISKGIEKYSYKPFVEQIFEDDEYLREIRKNLPNKLPYIKNDTIKKNVPIGLDPNSINQNIKDQINKLQDVLFQEMITVKPIQEIIDTTILNKMIKQTLISKGLKTPYQYGITEYADNNYVLVSEKASLVDLFQSPYSIQLFPNSLFESHKTLKLAFPKQRSFLILSLGLNILITTIFFIIIIIAFFVAYKIIFHQKKLSDIKTDFINNMTHELKTPIATITLASEMLKDNNIATNETSRKKYATIISEENKRLAHHVDKVLQIARLEKGEIQLNSNYADVHDILETVTAQFELIMNDKKVEIKQHFTAQDSIIKADIMHITNVFQNLIDNAIKYNEKNPIIEITTSNHNKNIEIAIKDNGIGLIKEDQTKIFEKFYRVQKGDIHDIKGFGLGLNYVKSIITAHQGHIYVHSKLKEGTTFVVVLPIDKI